MAETQKQPSVIRFEQEVAAKNYEAACVELLDILSKIDTNFGGVEGIEIDYTSQLNDELDVYKRQYLQHAPLTRPWHLLLSLNGLYQYHQ